MMTTLQPRPWELQQLVLTATSEIPVGMVSKGRLALQRLSWLQHLEWTYYEHRPVADEELPLLCCFPAAPAVSEAYWRFRLYSNEVSPSADCFPTLPVVLNAGAQLRLESDEELPFLLAAPVGFDA